MTRKHYIGAFTKVDAQGREQAVCGQFITPAERLHIYEDTSCWGCAHYLREMERPSRSAQERARTLVDVTAATPLEAA